MRRLLLLLPLSLLAGCYPYGAYYGYPPAYAQGPGYPPGAYPPGPPPYQGGPPASAPGPYARGAAGNGENCGTPDEPKPCPPLPKVPLQYYPANKQ